MCDRRLSVLRTLVRLDDDTISLQYKRIIEVSPLLLNAVHGRLLSEKENGAELQNRRKLPIHPVKAEETGWRAHVLRVDGLVRNRLALSLADLDRFPQERLTDDFTCVESWSVPKVRWSGVLLKSVLLLAEPCPEACYVQASAGNFSLPVTLERAEQALLAIRLSEELLPLEHGGPVRLVLPGGECFTSIKWLEHLELLAQPGENTAKEIAAKRLPAEQPHTSNGGKKSPS